MLIITVGYVSNELSYICPETSSQQLIMEFDLQNKKRKYERDRDDREEREKTPEEPEEDPLKDATTLYVGNLCVVLVDPAPIEPKLILYAQIFLYHRRTNSRAVCQVRRD